MAQKYDPALHGEGSRDHRRANKTLKERWGIADALNAELDPSIGYRYVPRDSVYVDEDILPRKSGADRALVKHYAPMLDQLPPIVVQRGTFKLVDGLHRLTAAFDDAAMADVVRIEEIDVEDGFPIIAEAFRRNVTHGRPLTPSEKEAYAKALFETYPDKPVSEVAREAGISRPTATKISERLGRKAETVTVTRGEQTYELKTPVRPEKPKPEPKGKVQTFTPSPEPSPDQEPTVNEPMALSAIRTLAAQRLAPGDWAKLNEQFRSDIEAVLPDALAFLQGVDMAMRPEGVLA